LLRFEIIDTGIGIPQAAQERIFEKFAQADESTTRRYGGTGLGTAIARQLVELMGGRIGLRSTPGIGTAFWFDIEFEQQTPPAELDTGQLQNCRVLRFAPSDRQATDVTHYLDGWRVPYHNVYSPQALVQILSEAPAIGPRYDVLILDRAPAAASIPALLEALHSQVAQLDLTVLFVYEHGQPLAAQAAHANAVYSLPAPVNKAILFNALHASHVLSAEDGGIINLAERLTRQYATPRKLRVLVAEDNETNRSVIGRILERAGHDYRLASDGQEALDALNAETFDLVIVDMHMPVAGGIEVFKLYRFAHAGEGELPFIMLTANATVEARQACREAGIRYFLTKPLSASRLMEVIARATDDTRTGQSQEREPLDAAATPGTRSETIIDRATLNEVATLGSSSDFVQKLSANFLRDGQQLLQSMAHAVNGNDTRHFTELAHALKGSAALLGLKELAAHAGEANRLLPEQVELQGRDCLNRLEAAFARAKSALEIEIARVRPAAH
jgi:two-component system sensor histidine kinase RpfC